MLCACYDVGDGVPRDSRQGLRLAREMVDKGLTPGYYFIAAACACYIHKFRLGRTLATGGTVAAVGSAAVLDYAADHPGLTATAILAASHPEESISIIGWVLRHPFLSLGIILLVSILYCWLVQLLRQSSQYALRSLGKRMGGED